MSFLDRIFGDANQKELNRLQFLVEKINQLEPEMEQLKDSDFPKKTQGFRERLKSGETRDELLPEAYALAREAAKRAIGQRPYDEQILAGIVLHQGKIAEQKTGEGKTLSATLPLYLNALAGKGAHLVTVNDFLAKFQAQWMGQIYHFLGLTVASIEHEKSYLYTSEEYQGEDEGWDETWKNLRPATRQEAYQADIAYGTNNEFGFDYLRDNMARSLNQIAQGRLNFAIVDEVDSILIDEARTPLIISAPAEESGSDYQRFAQIVRPLKPKADFELDEKARTVSILNSGIKKIEQALGLPNLYDAQHVRLVHHLEEALKAQFLFQKNKDYVVKEGEILIVDEFTGRLMPGRRYSEGLHQAIEAKEGVEVKRESDTLATISFQNFFRLYDKLAGMTGTAATEAEELYKIYKLEVVVIPTHRPMIRVDHQDKIYKTLEGKYQAIVEEVKARHQKGQPVLIGTISIEKNEELSQRLRRAGIPHQVLNAKRHQREAQIISQAGRLGGVTLATNMAGRGVDIILGGAPPSETQSLKSKTQKKDKKEQESGLETLSRDSRNLQEWEKEHAEVVRLGGLLVLGTERHEARRIDNQLRGRSGRQGDPGESHFYVSMEDDLMRIFGGERLKNLMERLGLPDDMPIEHRMISRSIESAQKKVEGHNFDIRKHLVEYDDVANKQREVIYRKRHQVLEGKGRAEDGQSASLHQEILAMMTASETKEYTKKISRLSTPTVLEIERQIYLRVIDTLWIEHLNTMDYLRTGIGLRGYGQKDPLVEYKKDAYHIFQRLLKNIEGQVAEMLLKLETERIVEPRPLEFRSLTQPQPLERQEKGSTLAKVQPSSRSDLGKGPTFSTFGGGPEGVTVTVRQKGSRGGQGGPEQTISQSFQRAPGVRKVGRNQPCPCGALKPDGRPIKYKYCHGR